MRAVILIGHGSLRSASGAAMIRIAARLREQGLAPLVEASFLNYSRPTLAEAVAKVASAGAEEIIVQPYFLIEGAYVLHDLPALLREVATHYPAITFSTARAFGDHPSMIDLAAQRVGEALAEASGDAQAAGWDWQKSALLLMAHGTPLEEANGPLYAIQQALHMRLGCSQSSVAYLDINQPDIPTAFDQLVEGGAEGIVALPYFLQLGRHVREDLPAAVNGARARYPMRTILLAPHLGYDLCLADVISSRVRAVLAQS
jgi:sirohydrochlorin cobaltochelatase